MTSFYRSVTKLFVCLFILFTGFAALGQNATTCPNADFSMGDFTNWQGFYGSVANPTEHQGFLDARQLIMKLPRSMDPATCKQLSTLPPGQNFSARLGNSVMGNNGEQLRYSVDVTAETDLFIYKYAVVLEDPGHDSASQPNFTIALTGPSGNIFDSACGYYYVYARQGLPEWHICDTRNSIWKDWTTVGMDLSPYIGQTVTIIFTAKNCSFVEHFGYAYISAACGKLEISYNYCRGDSVAVMTAPSGFYYQWDNGDTTQTSYIHNPTPGKVDSCILTSVNGCKVTIQGTFQPILITADFSAPHVCFGTPVLFSDSTRINQGEVTRWRWNFGDGSPGSDIQNPTHDYADAGTFNVTLTTGSSSGCPDSITRQVLVSEVPKAEFTADNICENNTAGRTIFYKGHTQLSVPDGYSRYLWSTGDTTHAISVTSDGWYGVHIVNGEICTASDSVRLLDCWLPFFIPDAFSPNGDGTNDLLRPVTEPEKLVSFSMIVYDRWGKLVFETTNVAIGWDGNFDGQPAPAGVYTYIATYRDLTGEAGRRTGTVTLVR